jgi:hypothetical protein
MKVRCCRCSALVRYTVTAYWDPNVELCRACCVEFAAKCDLLDRWPPTTVPDDPSEIQ